MGINKSEFINCRMASPDYWEIPNYLRERIEVKSVDDVLPEYKEDETLKGLYRESAKIKDKIKIRQFEIKDKKLRDEKI